MNLRVLYHHPNFIALSLKPAELRTDRQANRQTDKQTDKQTSRLLNTPGGPFSWGIKSPGNEFRTKGNS